MKNFNIEDVFQKFFCTPRVSKKFRDHRWRDLLWNMVGEILNDRIVKMTNVIFI